MYAKTIRRLEKLISTHAPAGGATGSRSACSLILDRFLLTPLREGRQAPVVPHWAWGVFLLTPLREGRPECDVLLLRRKHFYSRPCGRGD